MLRFVCVRVSISVVSEDESRSWLISSSSTASDLLATSSIVIFLFVLPFFSFFEGVVIGCSPVFDGLGWFLIFVSMASVQGYGQGKSKRFFSLLFGRKREELRVYSWLGVCINPEKVGESPAYCRSLVHTPASVNIYLLLSAPILSSSSDEEDSDRRDEGKYCFFFSRILLGKSLVSNWLKGKRITDTIVACLVLEVLGWVKKIFFSKINTW